MEGWFNAKELRIAVERAIDWTARHGDAEPYVQIVHMDDEYDRVRVLVGFDDGITEFTGFNWKRREPKHFPYSAHADD